MIGLQDGVFARYPMHCATIARCYARKNSLRGNESPFTGATSNKRPYREAHTCLLKGETSLRERLRWNLKHIPYWR